MLSLRTFLVFVLLSMSVEPLTLLPFLKKVESPTTLFLFSLRL